MATKPATAPDAAPTAPGFLPIMTDIASHVTNPEAAAILVTTNAFTANSSAAKALPALNPNQPNQSKPAPNIIMGRLCSDASCLTPWAFLNPNLGPTIRAAAKAAMPEFICTTVPPAKSKAPISNNHPPEAHTQ